MNWILDQFDFINTAVDFLTDSETQDAIKGYAKAIEEQADNIKNAVKTEDPNEKSFLGMQLFDDDFWKLLFKFFINFSVIMIIVRAIYYPIAKRKDYLFTYIMISLLIFMICFTLKKFEMGMGMALGLFAIFGIIRYRTDAIPIKEMTYLFIVIGVSVINALANKKMSYTELVFTNVAIIAVTYSIEKVWLLRHESRKVITYEKIDLILPEKHDELVQDLETRTGIKISRLEIGKVNFLNDTAQIYIYYYESEQKGHYFRDEGIN